MCVILDPKQAVEDKAWSESILGLFKRTKWSLDKAAERVVWVTLEANQGVERRSLERVDFGTLKENQASERQSLERVPFMTLEKRTKWSEYKAWSELFP